MKNTFLYLLTITIYFAFFYFVWSKEIQFIWISLVVMFFVPYLYSLTFKS